jgi:hypothetical protein
MLLRIRDEDHQIINAFPAERIELVVGDVTYLITRTHLGLRIFPYNGEDVAYFPSGSGMILTPIR